MVVLNSLGESPTSIAKKMQISHHTVLKHLQKINTNDPEIKNLINKIKESELSQLEIIGEMGRTALINYLSDVLEGKKQPNPIALTAICDRFFNQKRLLGGASTINIYSLSHIIRQAHERKRERTKKQAKDEGNEGG